MLGLMFFISIRVLVDFFIRGCPERPPGKSLKEMFFRYSLLIVFGGSLGNLFDRIYYSAVPDFIDFHINNFHWFVFNIADIFITIGIVCLIFDEILNDSKKI